MGHLCRQGDAHVDVARQPDGDELVGMRGEILAAHGLAVALVAVAHDGTVQTQAAAVVAHAAQTEVLDVERAKGLEELRVGSLHVQLQRVGQRVVLAEEGLAYLRNPLVGLRVEVTVGGLAGPQGDVVQIDRVVIGSAVDQCAELAVADGQRLLEEVCRAVVLQHHRCLLLCLHAAGQCRQCQA